MRLQMYAVFDSAVGCFHQPFFMRSKGEALRSFQDACTDGKSNFCRHPEDYSLCFMGDYEEETGTFRLPTAPERIVTAVDFTVRPSTGGNGGGAAASAPF